MVAVRFTYRSPSDNITRVAVPGDAEGIRVLSSDLSTGMRLLHVAGRLVAWCSLDGVLGGRLDWVSCLLCRLQSWLLYQFSFLPQRPMSFTRLLLSYVGRAQHFLLLLISLHHVPSSPHPLLTPSKSSVKHCLLKLACRFGTFSNHDWTRQRRQGTRKGRRQEAPKGVA